MRKLFSLAITFMMTCALASCGIPSKETGETIQTVKIWVIAPLSGPVANFGKDAVNAYTYIVDKFNASQTWLKIELIIEDDQCDGKASTSATQKLVNRDGVQAIVGGLCSAETMAGGQIAQSAGVVLLSPTSSATEIATIGAYVFKFYSDDSATKELSKYIIHQTPNNIVIVAENSDACVGFAKDLSAYFPDKASTTTYQTTEKDFVMLAKQLRNKLTPEDFLVMLPCNDVNLETIIKAFEREGILEMMKGRIAGNEMLTSASAYERLGNLLNGMKTAGLKELAYFSASGKALAEEFVSQKLVTSNQVWGVLEAEAMALIIEAIEKVGNNAEAIKDYLTAFNADNLKSGYFGDYYFTPERNAEWLWFLVYEIQDGELIVVD